MAGRLVLIGSLLLLALLTAVPAHATFPGANGRIAFAEAFTEDPGPPTSALSIAAPSRDADRPAWSSRGALAWVRDRKVYVSAADGARERLVTAGIDPDWLPNGRRAGSDACAARSARIRCGRRMDGRWPSTSPVRGVFVKTLGRRGLRIVANSQIGDSGSHNTFEPAWRPLPRRR